ncbi:hypothetical protein LTR56_006629 [Elasticomyces elasticus]|nr:hypothetical protein LTR22_012794 [Elasticomyces elasticus]KAK3649730.1 hypothetical protein LTR56_006629 [Elasticomyces elasticus]KAK4918065.1 hypothetical protein LTR49_014069 [Elasticomyces elasticus]KAK5757436.1 hypothetical protein LTS12_012519 [Elasticomyces elasticus]
MATNNGTAGGLEDQLRNLILQNGQEASVTVQHRPTVRLPPSGQNQNQNRPSHQYQQPPPRRAAAGFGGGLHSDAPTQHPGPSGKAQWKQSQKQRRAQEQQQQTQVLTPDGAIIHNQNLPRRQEYQQPHPQQYHPQQRQPQHHQQIDPNAFQRGGQVAGYYQRPPPPARQLFDPKGARGPPNQYLAEQHARQSQYLDHIASIEIPAVAMSAAERSEKEHFRIRLERIVHEVCAANPDRLPRVSLESFGSFRSGFANAGSDMDLVIVLPDGSPITGGAAGLHEDDLPRALERKLLDLGLGARLLTRTRVPIIKICEVPGVSLLDKLREEREKWDGMENERKYPHLHPEGGEEDGVDDVAVPAGGEVEGVGNAVNVVSNSVAGAVDSLPVSDENKASSMKKSKAKPDPKEMVKQIMTDIHVAGEDNDSTAPIPQAEGKPAARPPRHDNRPFTRERRMGPLDFPKDGVGIQSDINFLNPLGLHNTQLLRCYSMCDPRVQPMVLFVKSWAKRRKINSSYSGTLSSYGYVLMVLHYLVNIARPPVLPNLQSPWRPNAHCTPAGAMRTECDGWTVDFWRNEDEIVAALNGGQMSTNTETLGSLLEGFFRYNSSMGGGPQLQWTQQVLSLRSPSGILTKDEKGWVKAVTQEGDGKKVQHRYLFCIEDPFELEHNVARTVTHFGIVAIRDEFRRARRILTAVGFGQAVEGKLFEELVEEVVEVKEGVLLPEQLGQIQAGMNGSRANIEGQVDQGHEARLAKYKQSQANRTAKTKGPQQQPSRSLNVADKEAFPTLGGAKPKFGARSTKTQQLDDGQMSEISGDRARAYLEEVKRKKAEADAEMTATGAAEAVLGGE